MKRSERYTSVSFFVAFLTATTLVIPNIILDFTEIDYNWITIVLNIVFPFSSYLFITALFKITGKGILMTFPFMLFCAFQIVLLYLYGESIIAVDMFLNVATTDFDEASTLLNNLTPAIILVIILYLPPLIYAVWNLINKKRIVRHKRLLLWGWSLPILLVSGIALLVFSLTGYVNPGRDIFPINVIKNLVTAVERNKTSKGYPASAADFKYSAKYTGNGRRVVALVIGETARTDRWQLFGAEQPVNPHLSHRENLYLFPKSLTQSNTTHKSVPMMLTPLTSENFDSLKNYKSIITAFKEAGYRTFWLTSQPPNGSYTEKMSQEADSVIVMKYVPDVDLATASERLLSNVDRLDNVLLIFHTYGNHFPYNLRYPAESAVFKPDSPIEARADNLERLLNAYDNATLATDLAVDSIISVLNKHADYSAMVYAADHGEDIFDDHRNRFLHASPAPTIYQLRVPMFVWLSDTLKSNDERDMTILANTHKSVSPSVSVFHTVLDLGCVSTPYFNPQKSLVNESFLELPYLYLNDRNESLPLERSGMKEIDWEIMKKEIF